MFHHIEGIVSEIGPNLAVIDCGGIGFALNTTFNTLSRIKVGEKAKLFVAEAVKEDAFDLYGFSTKSERRCFEMLTAVSGIGPKAALSILSANTPEGLALAVMNNNEKALTVAPGIGKKIAQRVILELKDKIGQETTEAVIQMPAAVQTGESGAVNDAVTALSVLGYSSSEIAPLLKKLDLNGMTTEQIIKAVLKSMVK
ncbi:MAG: Holliday junction branch migration protein RuvA [Oscillospiraceae bacterium]|nr:Holliday junction branch migration protein RuvA [Oscillospiraceae bacterium]